MVITESAHKILQGKNILGNRCSTPPRETKKNCRFKKNFPCKKRARSYIKQLLMYPHLPLIAAHNDDGKIKRKRSASQIICLLSSYSVSHKSVCDGSSAATIPAFPTGASPDIHTKADIHISRPPDHPHKSRHPHSAPSRSHTQWTTHFILLPSKKWNGCKIESISLVGSLPSPHGRYVCRLRSLL